MVPHLTNRRAVRRALALLAASTSIVVAVCGSAQPAAAEPTTRREPVVYQPPVDAVVADPFRPPATAYGPGNRGLTYRTAPGQLIRASATGVVAFAGPVGGRLVVSIDHADGLRSTYTRLQTIATARGAAVSAGQVIGTSATAFHFGVRRGAMYLDPARLFGSGRVVHVRLVPNSEFGVGAAGPARPSGSAGSHRFVQEQVDGSADDSGGGGNALTGFLVDLIGAEDPDTCTPAGTLPPRLDTAGRRAVLVGGVGSSSEAAAIDDLDLVGLGYDGGDVMRASYRGGRIPGSGGGSFSDVPVTTYRPSDTTTDLREHGRRLADTLRIATALGPVDVYAHSQGGIVVRLAVAELADEPAVLAGLGVVVTVGTPHRGADLARVADRLAPLTEVAVDGLLDLAGVDLDPGGTSIRQMAPGSELIDWLDEVGVPDDVDFLAIGGRGDLVVPASRATVDGRPAIVVDDVGLSTHDALPGSSSTRLEVRRRLGGQAPTCESDLDRITDALVGKSTTVVTRAVGLGVDVAEHLLGLDWQANAQPTGLAAPVPVDGVPATP